MSREFDGWNVSEAFSGTCKSCEKTQVAVTHVVIKQHYKGGRLEPRTVATFCQKCAGQIFATDIPEKIKRLLHQKFKMRGGQYLGFRDYWINCKLKEEEFYESPESVRPCVCVNCEWFSGFRGVWFSGILCAYRTAQDKKDEARLKQILAMVCPDCGGELTDNTIKEGSHKGHGNIACEACAKVHIII
jgi:hypothetical protein